MPNWCQNVVSISGPPKNINELVQLVKSEDQSKNLGHTRNGRIEHGQLFSFQQIIKKDLLLGDEKTILSIWIGVSKGKSGILQ